MPLIFQLSLLLVEGLAENILFELSARFKDHNEEALGLLPEGEMEIERIKKSINILILVAGETHLFDHSAAGVNHYSISQMLAKFSVGTEKRKSAITGPPNPSLIGPIKDLPNIM